jgi:hypothetical protein
MSALATDHQAPSEYLIRAILDGLVVFLARQLGGRRSADAARASRRVR